MKKFLFTMVVMLCAATGFTACSSSEDGPNSYALGFASVSSSNLVEVGVIEGAFVAEFGGVSFSMDGNAADCDKDVKTRFQKVAQVVDAAHTFTGKYVYQVSRNGESIASYTFQPLK